MGPVVYTAETPGRRGEAQLSAQTLLICKKVTAPW
jgi:hypothetical protein